VEVYKRRGIVVMLGIKSGSSDSDQAIALISQFVLANNSKLCVVKTHMKQKHIEIMSTQQIITSNHAFRQDRPKSVCKQMEKDRLDLVKSRRSDLPITFDFGQSGKVAFSGGS
jgi:hypothetical protein